MNGASSRPAAAEGHGAFVPLLLVVVAVLAWTVFQTTELLRQRDNLRAAHAAQEEALAQAQKIRAAADSLAGKTQKLAQAGNPNATLVIENLKRRGVTIDLSAKTPSPPP